MEEGITLEERQKIWDLIYQKISDSVERKQNFAILFSTSEDDEGHSAIITEDQYLPLLETYLAFSQEQERYELCQEIKKIISEIKLWIEKN